jgi:hypothetical protein
VWANFITAIPDKVGEPFEYWGHLTYRNAEEIPSRHAEDVTARRFAYFVGEINKIVYGKRWMREGNSVWGALATEKHLSGYPHHHFIMGGQGLRQSVRRLTLMDMWDELYGIARVRDYKGQAAARYITKYVTKGGIVDVFLGAKMRDRLKT